MITRSLFVTVLASTLGSGVTRAQVPAPRALEQADSIAAAEFARDSIASLTIGIVTRQGLVWTKSYGFADMSTKRLANRQSVYRIGSITKMFTALTTMTAGIAREPRQEGPFWTGPVTMWDSTLHLALSHTQMDLAPGTKFLYSNIGYAILGATLGRAAGVPYVQWEKEHILGPLGMQHTAFEIEGSIMPNLTRGYDIRNGTPDGTQSASEAITGRGYKVPNGAIYTTIDDLSRFLVLQLGGGPSSVVPAARLDSAYKGVLDGTGAPTASYGIGFLVERRGASTIYGHSGAVAGFGADMEFDRDRQVGVIVLRNALGGAVNPSQLVATVLAKLAENGTSQPR